jgi:hypothetical protein
MVTNGNAQSPRTLPLMLRIVKGRRMNSLNKLLCDLFEPLRSLRETSTFLVRAEIAEIAETAEGGCA